MTISIIESIVFHDFLQSPLMYLQVQSAEKKFLESPRHDRISVQRVLEFRDDVDQAMEAIGHHSIDPSQSVQWCLHI